MKNAKPGAPVFYDIFISYRTTDGTEKGRSLKEYFDKNNYNAYFNPDEQKLCDFTEEIQEAIKHCKDFIILFTEGYRERLLNKDEKNYILEEILAAIKYEKNIVGLIAERTSHPTEDEDWPEEIKNTICHYPYITIPDDFKYFIYPPLDKMHEKILSVPISKDEFKDVWFSNDDFDIDGYSESLRKQAENGSCDALFQLANMYYYGIHTNGRDQKTAYTCFKQIFEHYSDADEKDQCYYNTCNMLARMYYDGQADKEQSYEKAYKFHRLASEGNLYSEHSAAFMSNNGIGCKFDYKTALNENLKNADKEDDNSKMLLAEFYEKFGKYKEAFEVYDSMSGHNPQADVAIGKLYLKGVLEDPPRPDITSASFYFHYAADAQPPSPEALFQLGRIHFLGLNRGRCEFTQAEKYFKAASEAGHIEASYMLGFMYEFGHVRMDNALSIQYFEKAVSGGDRNSLHHLAMLYQQPDTQNFQKAFHYAELSAKNGKPEGEYIYAALLFLGRGCKPDVDLAKKYARIALDDGMTQAKYLLDMIDSLKA